MTIPLKISFRDMPPSKAIEKSIREKAAKLDALYSGLMSCRVIVEAPHRHHHKGKAYVVRIDMTVPGGELVINREPKRLVATPTARVEELENTLTENHEPSKHSAHEDAYVAIRDAFNAAARKLQDYARRRRGKTKIHKPTRLARVAKIFPIKRYGFIETPDGRELYFHKNSVLSPGFERLAVGLEVHFSEEIGEKGPQARTVRPVAR